MSNRVALEWLKGELVVPLECLVQTVEGIAIAGGVVLVLGDEVLVGLVELGEVEPVLVLSVYEHLDRIEILECSEVRLG